MQLLLPPRKYIHMAPKRNTRTPRTKAQTEVDFSNLRDSLASKETLSPVEQAAASAKVAELRERTANVSVEAAVKKLTDTGLNINKAIADVQATIAAQVYELTEIRQAIELARSDLADVYGKEVAAASLAQLIADFDAKQKEFDLKVTQTREEWAKEIEQHNLETQEQSLLETKNRARENADYVYNRDQQRKKDNDTFAQQLADTKRNEELRKQELQRIWSTREAELKAQENEVAELRKQVETFPATLKAEVDKQVAVASNSVKREYETKIALTQAEINGEKRLLQAEVAGLNKTIASQQNQILELQRELTEAKKQVVEVAAKALESASGRNALSAVHDTLAATQPVNGGKRV
jgi:hypothetical protein